MGYQELRSSAIYHEDRRRHVRKRSNSPQHSEESNPSQRHSDGFADMQRSANKRLKEQMVIYIKIN